MEESYKMLNKDLTCTRGRGVFQYEPGKWYEEEESNCRQNGFHSAKNPLDCLTYYHNWDTSSCWLVEIDGTVDEDGDDSKVASTRIRLKKELDLLSFVVAAGGYIMDHPRLPNSHAVAIEAGEAGSNHFVICRGKNPRARGKEGDILCILREEKETPEIESAWIAKIGEGFRPGTWYDVEGRAV